MGKIIKILMLVSFIVLLNGCQKTTKIAPLTKVQVAQGWIVGEPIAESTVVVYKGVPYAAPPVGDLRWRAPQPVAAWDTVLQANTYAANPMQQMREGMGPWTSEYQPQGEIREDCLYLNIWTSAQSPDAKLPVMMYIPGGGFRDGSGNVPVYNGANLAKKGIIVVTINYRVGVFGLLAHPELTQESEHNSSGNYGLLDQLAALQWINKNIAAFGGDPEQVTIMGQSAGARSVHCLTASPLAKGLFARAIPQSGFYGSFGPGMDLAAAEKFGVKFGKEIGAPTLAELRAIPAQKLLDLAYDDYRFSLNVDGWFLPKRIEKIIAAGEQSDVPMLTGLVADEGSNSEVYGKQSAEEFIKSVKQQVGDLADELLAHYPVSTETESSESQKALQRDRGMVSMYLWAKEREKTGNSNVYMYVFTHEQPGPTRDRYLAFHSSELPYVFNNLKSTYRPWTDVDTRISAIVSDYWVNFIKTGNPNAKGLPEWPGFIEQPNMIMELGDEIKARPIAGSEKLEILTKIIR